jgi:ATP-dependent DNA helicase RecG
MSATPIPRSLALALYGDLSISRLDEMPAGRQKVDTFVVNESYRERLNAFIDSTVRGGGQVYVVCPSIEERIDNNEVDDQEVPLSSLFPTARRPMKNIIAYAEELRRALPHITIGILHGRMKGVEKEAIMNSFVGGDIQVLVSTTVIEVGVNVPNASLMIVENAENFGLSQLHQLRGRVGRGNRKSYCVLVSSFSGDTARQRLDIMARTNDGYEIAERDLAIRGPGDFFSSACNSEMRQSGGFNLRLAKCCDDPALMSTAFQEASSYIQKDPSLLAPESQIIRQELAHYFHSTENSIS